MYILDTNVISELRKPKPHGAVLEWMQSVDQNRLYLAAVSFGELQAAVELTKEQDASRAAEIGNWIDSLDGSFRVLPMEAGTFRLWATLLHRKSYQLAQDAMIAATAIAHGMTVVTRNVADFEPFGVPTINPFLDRR